jgi:uncharacterized protein YbjQ (UPF0145 family)
MGQGHNNDDDDDRKDLTRIEDLTEFLHEEDPDLESKFGDFDSSYQKADGKSTEVTEGLDLNALDEDVPPSLPETENENSDNSDNSNDDLIEMPLENEEVSESEFGSDTSLNFAEESETGFEETSFDETPFELNEPEEIQEEAQEDVEVETPVDDSNDIFANSFQEEIEQPVSHTPPERFEEVKTFAQNFSYGQIQGGGNPPFSIVIRNLKFEDDKESIITLLSEFGLVNEQNQLETEKALELGSLLIPQISEYSAIVLAHKFRRFDCDIEMGLSDEVHPSKSGDHNPKGLVKKDSLRQNKTESYKKDNEQAPAKEILITTTAQLEGYSVKKYIGIQTSFAIVDEEELERLKYVQAQNRIQGTLHEYAPEESDQLSSERAFIDYKSSFDYLFVSLAEELKSKAQKEKANALLGLNYQLQALPFEKTADGKNCYQLTASATMALVIPE